MIPILSADAARMGSNGPKSFAIDTARTCCNIHNMEDIFVAEWQKKARMKAGSGEKKAKKGDKDYPKTLDIESVEHRRNPEKYAEKPDDELSFEQRRKKRMNDPKRGINSPAFKEFMRKQGM